MMSRLSLYMPNGKAPSVAALRITPAETPPAETPPAEGGGSITLAGPDRQAFKDMLGHECKVGDKYTVELTATEVTPESISFTLDDVQSEYDEGAETPPEAAAPAGSKTPAMTYA